MKDIYQYDNCHDPIQKITGDAYRILCGLKTDQEIDEMVQESKRFNTEDEKRYPKEKEK